MTLLAHRLDGTGEPLLLLNGGAMSFVAWAEIGVALAQRFETIQCDLRGQFFSPGRPPEKLSGHADDVLALLDALDLPRVHVLGMSFGAEVGLYLAALHPERVTSLIAVTAVDRFGRAALAGAGALEAACKEAAVGGDRGRAWDLLASTAYSPRWADAHRDELAVRRLQVEALPLRWFAELGELVASLASVDLAPHLGSIRCPTLVVAAEDDAVMERERTEALVAGIRGARLVVVPDTGHAVFVERPSALLSICLDFLEELASD